MACHHPTKSLHPLFLNWTYHPLNRLQNMKCLYQTLSESMSRGWPVDFISRLAERLRQEASSQLPADVPTTEVWPIFEKSLILLVYNSNYIDSAGVYESITFDLCQHVFRGLPITEKIEETSNPEYQDHLEALIKSNRPTDINTVIRSCREVIQHEQALAFIIEQVVLNNQSITEQLLLETHKILYTGLVEEDDEVKTGQYRDFEIAVKYETPDKKMKAHRCIRASAVPEYMKEMIGNLTKEIEQPSKLVPYTLAARYHHQFTMIHPFGDGNQRMVRILMNLILIKYAGHVCLFGGDDDEKKEYLDIVTRGAKQFDKEDMEVAFEEHTGHHELIKYMVMKSKDSLKEMRDWAQARRGGEENRTSLHTM
ncbi:Filamentation induced by cAMP/death on curing-related protein [Podospora fimiseda]|uniref:Filamentation induced by cAMP/death on curing-related protein n=1 Tax=Podospora fimiseda TaxID=252190 RepID=A0AAN7BVG8_9PEZI|nr:Filamentation induced by cAMP/death on curing-related protein [Podospora fimiseda]